VNRLPPGSRTGLSRFRLASLRRAVSPAGSREKVFRTPPVEWIKDRLAHLQEVLEHRTAKSAHALRNILGPIRMELVTPDIGRPFYRAVTTLDALALTEAHPDQCGGRFEFFAKVDADAKDSNRREHAVRVVILDHEELPAYLNRAGPGVSDKPVAQVSSSPRIVAVQNDDGAS